MGDYPRIVLADVMVPVDGRRVQDRIRKGTVVDVPPGSALETDYGPGNLSPVIPASAARRSPDGGDPTWAARARAFCRS